MLTSILGLVVGFMHWYPRQPLATYVPERSLPESARGMVLTLHDADPRRSYADDVRALHELGASAISIVPTWRMATIQSPTVARGSATDQQLEETLRIANELGMAVLIAPMIQVDHLADNEWRGVLAPPDWECWFSSYRQLMLDVAKMAEQHGVAAILIGSELCSTETFKSRWHALIREVRSPFKGSLGYQANWDHREVPTFLDALDFLGSNAYFELVKVGERPTVVELVAAWTPFRDDLTSWAAAHAKPLVITEVGYPSIAGGAAFPWDYTRTTPIDLEEQRRAMVALFEAWRGTNSGMFVYEWWGDGGHDDRGYTPRNKPAEAVIREWLRQVQR